MTAAAQINVWSDTDVVFTKVMLKDWACAAQNLLKNRIVLVDVLLRAKRSSSSIHAWFNVHQKKIYRTQWAAPQHVWVLSLGRMIDWRPCTQVLSISDSILLFSLLFVPSISTTLFALYLYFSRMGSTWCSDAAWTWCCLQRARRGKASGLLTYHAYFTYFVYF